MNLLFLCIALFISLFVLMYLLIVPTGVYATSPTRVTMDRARRFIEKKLTEGDKASRLAVVNRSAADIIKTGLFIGFCLGLVTLIASFKFIGVLAIPLSIAAMLAGIFLAEFAAQNEFRAWQARLFEGVPVMVNFIPAFLEVGSIIPREAISMTIPFLPEPLKSEVWAALDKIKRTGDAGEAFDMLAKRARNPVLEAICFRMATAWKSRVEPSIFDDLSEDIDDVREMAATRATTIKGGMFAMISVLGLLGALLVFGYPGLQIMLKNMGGGFGF